MALKAVVKSLEEVPEPFRDAYTKAGNEFVLDVEDGGYQERINEFRTNNIELRRTNEQLSKDAAEAKALREKVESMGDLDPKKAREAMERLEELEEQNLLDAGKLDEVLSQRTERMRMDYEGKVEALNKALETASQDAGRYRGQLSEVVIDSRLQQAVSGVAPVRRGAMRDILARGREVWKLDDTGNPTPIGPDGKVLYGTDGQSPLSMEEWAGGLRKEADYLFEANAGGGGGGGNRAAADGGSIQLNDQQALNSNIEAIASGKVRVVGE